MAYCTLFNCKLSFKLNSSSSLKFLRSCSQLQSEGCINGPSFFIQLALGVSCKIISVYCPHRRPQRSFTWENPKCAHLSLTLVLLFHIHLLVRWQNWPIPKFWGWETSTKAVQIRTAYCKCSLNAIYMTHGKSPIREITYLAL